MGMILLNSYYDDKTQAKKIARVMLKKIGDNCIDKKRGEYTGHECFF